MRLTTEEWAQIRAELSDGDGLGLYDVVDAIVADRDAALEKRFVERITARIRPADHEDDGVEYWDAGPWDLRRDATSATRPVTYELAGRECTEEDLRRLATAAWSAIGEPPAATLAEHVDLVLARVAAAVGELEELSKDLTWEIGEVLVPRDVVAHLVRTFQHPLRPESPTAPAMPPRAPACRVCGCTEFNACPPTCSWREPDLCSTCDDAAAALASGGGPAV